MKISLNWLKEYMEIGLSPEKVSEVLTDIGLEVEGEEIFESIKGSLEGIVVGEVLECDKHPGADKLSLTKVDIGGEQVQIVCGAPNVAKGQKVMVATIGTTLYDEKGEAWKIKKGKIRGEESFGMICAEDELGLGKSHDGIMVLDKDTVVGKKAAELFDIKEDVVFEIGLTPNRSDATSHIGTAKDLAAALKINYGHSGKVNLPSVDNFKVDDTSMKISVEVENSKACPRYSGLCISNIVVKESPEWLKLHLNSIGVQSINNIVDITNFVLHEWGQPLHAFDYDMIGGSKIVVKTLSAKTEFITLDDNKIELLESDLMICDGNSLGMCMGGVYGGLGTGVSDKTTRIFLESAHFDAETIRKSSMHHILRTEAAKTFEKGTDPNITLTALKRAAILIKELAGGVISSEIIDIYPEIIKPKEVSVKFKNINRLIGVDIPVEDILAIFDALEIGVKDKTEEGCVVLIPTNKPDVYREADVIEEVLRIFGFNKVPISDSVKSAISYLGNADPYKVKNIISDFLVSNGYLEMMNLSLSQSKYYGEGNDELVFVNNTSNRHLDLMRPDMVRGALETLRHNLNRQQNNLKFFEFGKTYIKKDDYIEVVHLSLILTGKKNNESWIIPSTNNDFFSLKGIIVSVLNKLGLSRYQNASFEDETYYYGMKFFQGQRELVNFGELNPKLVKSMDVKGNVFFADFNWDNILKAIKKNRINYVPVTKFPTIRRDIAIVIPKNVDYGKIESIISKESKKILKEVNLFDVYEDENKLGEGKKSYAISMIFEGIDKTLKDKDIDKVLNKIVYRCEKEIGAKIRG